MGCRAMIRTVGYPTQLGTLTTCPCRTQNLATTHLKPVGDEQSKLYRVAPDLIFVPNTVPYRYGTDLTCDVNSQVLGPMRVQLLHPVSRFKRVQSLQHLCR
jgi:hypothetical protein